jgi:hypothetical protein
MRGLEDGQLKETETERERQRKRKKRMSVRQIHKPTTGRKERSSVSVCARSVGSLRYLFACASEIFAVGAVPGVLLRQHFFAGELANAVGQSDLIDLGGGRGRGGAGER